MKKAKEKSIVSLYKKQIAIIIILISIVIITILASFLLNLNRNYKDSSLINILGRQRILTQQMAKDANRIYQLNSASTIYSAEDLRQIDVPSRLEQTKADLKGAMLQYVSEYLSIKKGHIILNKDEITFNGALKDLTPIFIRNNKIWTNFQSAIDVVLSEEKNTDDVFRAEKYINENNELLLNYSDQITKIVVNYNAKQSIIMFSITAMLSIFTLLLLILFFMETYINLFVPLNQLYEGIGNFGINNINTVNFKTPYSKDETLIPLFSEVRRVIGKFRNLIKLIETLNKNLPFKDILNIIFDSFSEYIPYTHIGVALVEDDGKSIKASYGVSSSIHKNLAKRIVGYKTEIDSTSLNEVFETGEVRVINDLEEYLKGKPMKEYNQILMDEGIRSSITFPLKSNNKPIGIIFFSSNLKNVYKKEHIEFLKTLANSIMLSLEEDIIIDDMIISSNLALATLTEERDPETGEHLTRMKKYATLLAELLLKEDKYQSFIDIDYINDIERFSPVHDIGKVAISDDILLKPGKLTKEEFEIMKTHTTYGGRVLRLSDENLKKHGRSIFTMGIEICEGHHEKWDGSGYPKGKKGEDIPLSARIVAIADVLDALTSKRPYKIPFTFADSYNMIVKESGTHFDPFITDVFIKNIESFEHLFNVFQHN